jgi:hypothetical protein
MSKPAPLRVSWLSDEVERLREDKRRALKRSWWVRQRWNSRQPEEPKGLLLRLHRGRDMK